MTLTKKGVKFLWVPEAVATFKLLTEAFTSTPVMIHFDPEKAIKVGTKNSDYVSAGVVSQHDDDRVLHPVAFYFKKHSPAECN